MRSTSVCGRLCSLITQWTVPASRPRCAAGSSDEGLVDEAPAPRLTRLEGAHHGVPGLLVVGGRVAVGGVAAADVTAAEADAQVQPGELLREALLAAVGFAGDDRLGKVALVLALAGDPLRGQQRRTAHRVGAGADRLERGLLGIERPEDLGQDLVVDEPALADAQQLGTLCLQDR